MLNHELDSKVDTPVMLMRNIVHPNGLYNGTRLIITRLGNHVLEGKVIIGYNAWNEVLIPVMLLNTCGSKTSFQVSKTTISSYCFLCNDYKQKSGSITISSGIVIEKTRF